MHSFAAAHFPFVNGRCHFRDTINEFFSTKLKKKAWRDEYGPDWRKLTKRAFTRKIHKLLLTVLEIEDYYVDAHSVILNLNTSNYYTL